MELTREIVKSVLIALKQSVINYRMHPPEEDIKFSCKKKLEMKLKNKNFDDDLSKIECNVLRFAAHFIRDKLERKNAFLFFDKAVVQRKRK